MMEGLKVAFDCLIKQVTIKSLVSGDKAARIILEIDSPDDETLNKINQLHKADETLKVVFLECKEEN